MNKNLKILLFTLVLLLPFENFGQKVIDIGESDYIDVDYFFEVVKKIKNQKYISIHFTQLYPKTDKDTMSYEDISEYCVPIKKFSIFKPRDYKKLLYKKEQICKEENSILGYTHYNVITMYNPYVVCVLNFDSLAFIYEKDRNKYLNIYGYDVEFYNYNFIKSGKKYFMRLLIGEENYNIENTYAGNSDIFLAPKKDSLCVYDYNDGTASTINGYKQQEDDLYDIAKLYMNNNWHYCVQKNKKGESILCNIWGDKIYPQAFDSISIRRDLIIAEKNGEYYFINSKLELLPIKARSVVFFYPNYRVLCGNEVKTLTLDGTLQDQIVEYTPFRCGNTSHFGDSFKKNNDSIFLTDLPQEKNIWYLKTDEMIEDLYFANGYSEIWFRGDEAAGSERDRVLVKNKNGKYGISTYFISGHDNTFQLIEKLPAVYDSIKVINAYEYPVLIYKDGLVGYFPLMNEAKYKEIKIDLKDRFRDKFIRFTLPNGQKGWLNIENKKEYIDL